jgi:sugar O-acyltransferase (sialic acid O-acetyltransferase NeuD family)
MSSKRKLVLIGDGTFAEVAFEYFSFDSEYEVVGFAVEREFKQRHELLTLPVVAFEEIEQFFKPSEHSFFVAITYFKLNRVRSRYVELAKAKGFTPASYVSSQAFVWQNCQIGEHCFIFEKSVVQPFAVIGDDVIIWSSGFIAHHSQVGNHTFVAAHVVINGTVTIGTHCFLGANSTIANHLHIGNDCLIGAGSLVLSDVEDSQIVMDTWKKRTLSSSSRLQSEFYLKGQ